jgi:hypothetical protein
MTAGGSSFGELLVGRIAVNRDLRCKLVACDEVEAKEIVCLGIGSDSYVD